MPRPKTRKQELEIIAQRLKEELLAEPVAAEEVLSQLALQEDGSWPDVDYRSDARTHWSPAMHTVRLALLARAYSRPDSAVETRHVASLLQGIRAAVHYWVQQDPQSDNWWWNAINTPKYLSQVLLLLGKELPEEDFQKAAQIVHRSGFSRTGANLTWEAGNLLVLAAATGDVALAEQAIDKLKGEVKITTKEGIQPDGSFHQHGPQLYMSNYGELFSQDHSRYALLLQGTLWEYSPEMIAALSLLVREGQQWFLWGPQWDYHALGRQLDNPSVKNRGRAFVGVCERMALLDPEHADEYRAFAARLLVQQAPSESGPRGNRHYWRSDIMVHRPGHFHTSVRMHSTRTYATEVRVNRDNLKGYHLSDGAYFLLQRGDEYQDIQPVWDWLKLPGVTCPQSDAPLPYGAEVKREGNTAFVGGVSDGRFGVAAMELDKDDVRARAGWFFFDQGWVALGAAVTAAPWRPLATTLNQCLLKGDVYVKRGGKVTRLRTPYLEARDLQAVYHDGVGYALLEPLLVGVTVGPQEGRWDEIEGSSPDHCLVTQDVFNLWIIHPMPANPMSLVRTSYAYLVVPGVTQATFVSFPKAGLVDLLENREEQQAVYLPQERLLQAIFHVAGELQAPEGRRVVVSAPCLLMWRETPDGAELTVADPTQLLTELQVTLSGQYAGEGADLLPDEDATRVTIALPREQWAGQSVMQSLSRR